MLDWLDFPVVDFGPGDGILGGIVLGVVAVIVIAIVIVVVLPAVLLLGEAVVVVFATVALGRSWVVDAYTPGPPPASRSWRVRGVFGSRAAMREVADELRRGVRAEPENVERRA